MRRVTDKNQKTKTKCLRRVKIFPPPPSYQAGERFAERAPRTTLGRLVDVWFEEAGDGPMNPSQVTVRHTPLKKGKVDAGATTLDKIVTTGAQSAAVQNDPLCKQALANLQGKTATVHTSIAAKKQAAQTLDSASMTLKLDYGAARSALVTYEEGVRVLANGDASIIAGAGLLTRDMSPPEPQLAVVVEVIGKKGKLAAEGVVKWPEVAGATSYAVQVNFTPQTPSSAYTALGTATRRTRVVKAPTAGAQFLVQVAAVASDGTQSAWSDAILVTAR